MADAGTAAPPHVVLLGDSTLDNVVWVDRAADAVPPTLQRLLNQHVPGATVTNLAADGFTSTDVLRGAPTAISYRAREVAGDPFPTASPTAAFYPLTELKAMASNPTHIVLSVGGNDIREILGAMHELPVRIAAFHENFPQIATQCSATGAQVIIMMQYRPDLSTDEDHYGVYRAIDAGVPGPSDPVGKINHVMELVYPPVLELACANGWDVLDLPNSFDIQDSDLYRCQIEPSARGGALIAELIAHAVLNRRRVSAAPSSDPSRQSLDAEYMCQPVLIAKPVGAQEVVETPLVPAGAVGVGDGVVTPHTWRVCPQLWEETGPPDSHQAASRPTGGYPPASPSATPTVAISSDESSDDEHPTISAHCLVCEAKGRGGDVRTEYRCLPCRCEVLCSACSARMATGGKCRGCGNMFAQLERV